MSDIGYFIFSFDLELATGYFDNDAVRHNIFSKDGVREREAIYRLIDLFERYSIVGTWATVGHLFYKQCEFCEFCPMIEWKGYFSSFNEVYGTDNALWYGADVIDFLLTHGRKQEIAFHGYSHKIFDEQIMSRDAARMEILEWLRISQRKGVIPHAIAFPRNIVGYLDVLHKAGLICYRAETKRSAFIRNKLFGKYIKALDQILGVSKLPIFNVTDGKDNGMVKLFASQCFFDLNRSFELFLDSLNLHKLRFRRVMRGIMRAAEQNKIVHLWAHPCDFQTEKDFQKLEYVLDLVTRQIKLGRMRSVGMTEMALIILDGRFENQT